MSYEARSFFSEAKVFVLTSENIEVRIVLNLGTSVQILFLDHPALEIPVLQMALSTGSCLLDASTQMLYSVKKI